MVSEVELLGTMTLPQGLKPTLLHGRFSARLKWCPDTRLRYSGLMDFSKVS